MVTDKDLEHLDIQRTCELIRRQYIWKCLYESIVDFNTKCILCQEVNLIQKPVAYKNHNYQYFIGTKH